ADDRARDDPDVVDRDRLGAGIMELVDHVPDVRRPDRSADRDRDAVAGARVEPGPAADAFQGGADLRDRGRAAGPAQLERVELALQPGDLAAQPVVVRVQVADKQRQVLGRERAQPIAGGLGPDLDDDEQAEHERDERQEQLASRGPQRSGHGAAPDGAGDGTMRDARSVRLPANAGMSTAAGSANETSSPNVPRRVWMKSRQPCDRLSWSSRSSGPIARTWYGGEREGELTRIVWPISRTPVETVTRSPLTEIASAPASQS